MRFESADQVTTSGLIAQPLIDLMAALLCSCARTHHSAPKWPSFRFTPTVTRGWLSQDIRVLLGLNTIIREHPLVWAPHSTPSLPTRMRSIVAPPGNPLLQYLLYNIGNGNGNIV